MTSYFVDGCTSPVGLCTQGTVEAGPLTGSTRFTALTLAPGPTPDELLYTGELVITTRNGTVTIHDFGVFNTATGVFSEVDQIVGGTRRFKHGTGTLGAQGVGTATGFIGTLSGAICHDGGEDEGEE